MITAPPGTVATYKHTNPDHQTELPVIAYDDDGNPLVIGEEGRHSRHLVRADVYGNFDGITEEPYPTVIALLPAGGWCIEYTSADGKWTDPLVGWGLRRNGDVVPLVTDCDGCVDDTDHFTGQHRIYHPGGFATASPAE